MRHLAAGGLGIFLGLRFCRRLGIVIIKNTAGIEQGFYLAFGHLVVLRRTLRLIGYVRGYRHGLVVFGNDTCDIHLVLGKYPAEVGGAFALYRLRLHCGRRSGHYRLLFRRDEVLLVVLLGVLVGKGFAVKSYPIFVIGRDTVSAAQDIVYVIFFQTHSFKDRICKRGTVLKYTAGKEVVYI